MTRKVTSYRLPEMTLNQIEQLAKTTGSSDANVIAFAIDRMFQQEIKTMTTQTTTVTLKFVAQSGHVWEETVEADDIDSTIEQTVATHGDIDHVERLADPDDISGETVWRFE